MPKKTILFESDPCTQLQWLDHSIWAYAEIISLSDQALALAFVNQKDSAIYLRKILYKINDTLGEDQMFSPAGMKSQQLQFRNILQTFLSDVICNMRFLEDGQANIQDL